MDAEDALIKLGAASVAALPTVKEALAAIRASRPDFAVLDFNLDGETTGDITAELARLEVPFLFVTRYGDALTIPEKYRTVPIVRKPISLRELADKIGFTGEASSVSAADSA